MGFFSRPKPKLEQLCVAYDEMVMIQPNTKPFNMIWITTNRERYKRKIKKGKG